MRSVSHPLRGGPALAATLALALLLPACRGAGEAPAAAARPAPAVPVRTARAEVRTTPVQVAAIGTVEASSTVSLRPRVGGILQKVHFAEGDEVKAGAVMFTIDPAPYRVALEQARARLSKDEVLAKNAADELERSRKLLGRGLVTQSAFDAKKAAADAARATLAVDRAQLDDARLQLSWCTIEAPVSGRTGRLLVHEGNLVSAGAASPLAVINRMAPAFVVFSAPEAELEAIRAHFGAGERLAVTAVAPGSAKAHEGVLTFLDNAVDPDTGTVLLKASFENADRALWPGQFVNVVLTLAERPGSVVVPEQAVQTGQKGDYVFVVQADRTVASRPVKLGARLPGQVVVESGLEGGEEVVTDGQLRLTPGARVEVRSAAPEADKEPS